MKQDEYRELPREHEQAEEHTPVPEEYSPGPEEYVPAREYESAKDEYEASPRRLNEDRGGEEKEQKKRKLMRYLLAAAAMTAVVTLSAGEMGLISLPGIGSAVPDAPVTDAPVTDAPTDSEPIPWGTLTPHAGNVRMADLHYPTYTVRASAGKQYRVVFHPEDEAARTAYFDYLAEYLTHMYHVLSSGTADMLINTPEESPYRLSVTDNGLPSLRPVCMGFSAEGEYTVPVQADQRPLERVKFLDTGIYLIPMFGQSGGGTTVLTAAGETVQLSDSPSCLGYLDLSAFTNFNFGNYGRVSAEGVERYSADSYREHRAAIAVYIPTFSKTDFDVYAFSVTEGEAVLTLPTFLSLEEYDPADSGGTN
ncbi:MAG: hypothetical protein E7654_09565 [Ruminococcaceae bacterium]|nr:hypothetical protein [Oscillospiraceae bacterium]